MNIPIKVSAIDLAHLEQTLVTAGYALIVRKIEAITALATTDAIKAKTWEETLTARGKMEGLKLALLAPAILKEEIETRLKKEGK